MKSKTREYIGYAVVFAVTLASGIHNLVMVESSINGPTYVILQLLTFFSWMAAAGYMTWQSSKPINTAFILTFVLICGYFLSGGSILMIFFYTPFMAIGNVIYSTYIPLLVEIWIIALIKKKKCK